MALALIMQVVHGLSFKVFSNPARLFFNLLAVAPLTMLPTCVKHLN
jgi:hypothetical protein